MIDVASKLNTVSAHYFIHTIVCSKYMDWVLFLIILHVFF